MTDVPAGMRSVPYMAGYAAPGDEFETSIANSPVSIGRFTYGTENLIVKQWGEGASLTIGSFCSIASEITVYLGGNHRVDWMTTFPFGHVFVDELGSPGVAGHPHTNGDVVIGSDVWLGNRATILSGVFVHPGAVVAANSTVVDNVGPYEVVGGNPAKLIHKRFPDDVIVLLLDLSWWDLPVAAIKEMSVSLLQAPTAATVQELIGRYRL